MKMETLSARMFFWVGHVLLNAHYEEEFNYSIMHH
jgi:hypothetical protein